MLVKEIFSNLLYYFSLIIQLLIFILGTYYFAVSLFGWYTKKERLITNKKNRYAIVVAAHNEENVIEAMIDSVKNLNYDKSFFDVFVIADNCTDSTSDISRQHGATVFERTDTKTRGKGYALDWFFKKLFKLNKEYDYVLVFDADNIVSKNFLIELDKVHNSGCKVVQCYIETKNPQDSWISTSYAITYWNINRLFQNSRFNLNLHCQLNGCGFSVDTDVLRTIGWGATCLAEDMEFTMKLALNDIQIGWAQNAILYDEKPLTLKQSWVQRIRWMQGQSDVASRYCGPLIKKAIKERVFMPIDTVFYLLQPMRVLCTGAIMILAWLQHLYPVHGATSYLFADPIIWNLFILAQFLYTPIVLILDKKINWYVVRRYILYYFFTFTWVPITVIGVFNKNKKEWTHTVHSRKIKIADLEEV